MLPTLDQAVIAMADKWFPLGYAPSPTAPNTFEALCARMDTGQFMLVYDGASDQTIFGSPQVNYAFRAWHDFHHWTARLPFTPEGEARACALQCRDIIAAYGDNATTRHWCALLDAEVNGQLAYAQAHAGEFPVNQAAFVAAYLDAPSVAIAGTF